MRRLASRVLFAAVLLLTTVPAAQAQVITGTVRDDSGAVMPGVTVEASSPALIEKVRSAIDGWDRPVPNRQLESWHLHGDVHACRLQHRQARRHRADRRLHGDRQRRPESRRARRNDYRVRRLTLVDIQSVSKQTVLTREVTGSAADGAQHPGCRRADSGRRSERGGGATSAATRSSSSRA